MISAIFRTAFYGVAAYGAYVLARKYYPSQIDSAVDMAKSRAQDLAKDASKVITDKSKSISSSVDTHVRKAV